MTIQNSEKTVYLHIGTNKTGSSSIQAFLFDNRLELEKYGVFYPIFKDVKVLNGPNINSIFKLSGESLREDCEKEVKRYLDVIQKNSCKSVILSHENLCFGGIRLEVLLRLLTEANFTIKIVVYLRPVATWLTSFWYQNMKPTNIRHESLSTMLDVTQSRCSFFMTLIEKFGKENIIIKPYEKCQWKNKCIIEDFLSIFDIPLVKEFNMGRLAENTSKGRNTAELMRIISCLNLDEDKFSTFRMHRACTHDIKVIETLTDAEILAVTEKHAPDFKKLANIYGKESFFVNELPSCYGKERPAYDTVSFSLEQHAILIEALEENKREKDAMKEQLAQLQGGQGKLAPYACSSYSKIVLPSLKLSYLRCRIAAAITFGKTRQKYKNKKKQIKQYMALFAKS